MKGTKSCENCGTTRTPMWRGTLCNACGMHKRRHGVDREPDAVVRPGGNRSAKASPRKRERSTADKEGTPRKSRRLSFDGAGPARPAATASRSAKLADANDTPRGPASSASPQVLPDAPTAHPRPSGATTDAPALAPGKSSDAADPGVRRSLRRRNDLGKAVVRAQRFPGVHLGGGLGGGVPKREFGTAVSHRSGPKWGPMDFSRIFPADMHGAEQHATIVKLQPPPGPARAVATLLALARHGEDLVGVPLHQRSSCIQCSATLAYDWYEIEGVDGPTCDACFDGQRRRGAAVAVAAAAGSPPERPEPAAPAARARPKPTGTPACGSCAAAMSRGWYRSFNTLLCTDCYHHEAQHGKLHPNFQTSATRHLMVPTQPRGRPPGRGRGRPPGRGRGRGRPPLNGRIWIRGIGVLPDIPGAAARRGKKQAGAVVHPWSSEDEGARGVDDALQAEFDALAEFEAPPTSRSGRAVRSVRREGAGALLLRRVEQGRGAERRPHPTKRCTNCGTRTTPEWRTGPSDGKVVCNACYHYEKRNGTKRESDVWDRDGAARDGEGVSA
ncbi:unnamed protein product [Pedinophyceae sp. YPF-701]|nr:unnamed protein product [Pedinophyceae sp. YPF-701]